MIKLIFFKNGEEVRVVKGAEIMPQRGDGVVFEDAASEPIGTVDRIEVVYNLNGKDDQNLIRAYLK